MEWSGGVLEVPELSSAERDVEAGGRAWIGGPEAGVRRREEGREAGLHYSRLRHLAFVRLCRPFAAFATFSTVPPPPLTALTAAAAVAAAWPKPPLELCRLHWLGTSER